MIDYYNTTLKLRIGVDSRAIPASKELATEGTVRSAGSFYLTGEEPVNRKFVWWTIDKR